MKTILVIMVFIYVANSLSTHNGVLDEWESFKVKYDKHYEGDENTLRLIKFLENREKIAEHNRKFESGQVTYSMAINQYGDLRPTEYFGLESDTIEDPKNITRPKGLTFQPSNVELPEEIDWRKRGAVTPVKNQGLCGSCWAFSVVGTLEGQLFQKNNSSLVSLSEQNLIDCSRDFGTNGCMGGDTKHAYEYLKLNHDLDTADTYSYLGNDSFCHYEPKNSTFDVTGFVEIEKDNEDHLQAAVYTVGPISVVIELLDSFMFYDSGVYYEPECSNLSEWTHAVLAVGYGTDNRTGQQYWLVKNSFGNLWGEFGYIKIARNKNNNCGIASDASYPLLK